MKRIQTKMSPDSENSQAELRSQVNQQTKAGNVAEAVSCGHHYFNPQWVYQEQTSPALMYNDAVYFTVADDGTHYFHQSFKGEFYPVYPSTMDNKSRRPKTCHPRVSGNQHSDGNSANWTNHRQISLNTWNPWQKGDSPLRPSNPQGPRKRKDVRSTIVPMFPEAFSLGRREPQNSHDELLDDILSNRKIGLKFTGERPGKLR